MPWEMFNRRAISLFDNPSDTRRMISRSGSVTTASTFSATASFRPSGDGTSAEPRPGGMTLQVLARVPAKELAHVPLMRRKNPVAWNFPGAGDRQGFAAVRSRVELREPRTRFRMVRMAVGDRQTCSCVWLLTKRSALDACSSWVF